MRNKEAYAFPEIEVLHFDLEGDVNTTMNDVISASNDEIHDDIFDI